MAKIFYNKNILQVMEQTVEENPYTRLTYEELNESQSYAFEKYTILSNSLESMTNNVAVATEELENAIAINNMNNLELIAHTHDLICKRLGISRESLSVESINDAKLSTEGLIQGIIEGIIWLVKKIATFIYKVWMAVMEFIGLTSAKTEKIVNDTETVRKLVKEELSKNSSTKEDNKTSGITYTMKVKKHNKKDLKIIKSQNEEINKLKKQVADQQPISVVEMVNNADNIANVSNNIEIKEEATELSEKVKNNVIFKGTPNDISMLYRDDNLSSKYAASMQSASAGFIKRTIVTLALHGLKPTAIFTEKDASEASKKFKKYLAGLKDASKETFSFVKEVSELSNQSFSSDAIMKLIEPHKNKITANLAKGLEYLDNKYITFSNKNVKDILFKNKGDYPFVKLDINRAAMSYSSLEDDISDLGSISLYGSTPSTPILTSQLSVNDESNALINELCNNKYSLKSTAVKSVNNIYSKLSDDVTSTFDEIRKYTDKLSGIHGTGSNTGDIVKNEYLKNVDSIIKTYVATSGAIKDGVIYMAKTAELLAKIENSYVKLVAKAD